MEIKDLHLGFTLHLNKAYITLRTEIAYCQGQVNVKVIIKSLHYFSYNML